MRAAALWVAARMFFVAVFRSAGAAPHPSSLIEFAPVSG
jgi:hypothetical protein